MKAYLFPGQGSQKKGMGADLFDAYPDLTAKADNILGYSIKELCLEDPRRELTQTQFTQPALFVVNALMYLRNLEEGNAKPDFVAGHSLGEYNALFAAGCFDFETGLRLVQRRGALMSQAKDGGMAAVIGLVEDQVRDILEKSGMDELDIANLNTTYQVVLSGPKQQINDIKPFFEEAKVKMYTPLKVSAAFHSRYMEPARDEFAAFLNEFDLADPEIPVIANITARPYEPGAIRQNLANQITGSVRWTDSIRYLLGFGVTDFQEVGPGKVLAKMQKKIETEAEPLDISDHEKARVLGDGASQAAAVEPEDVALGSKSAASDGAATGATAAPEPARDPAPQAIPVVQMEGSLSPLQASELGALAFREAYNTPYAYAAGGMGNGISSASFVSKLAQAGILAFYGASGLPMDTVTKDIDKLLADLPEGSPFGVNMSASSEQEELDLAALCIAKGVHNLEAAGFIQQLSPALVWYRLKGIHKDGDQIIVPNRILAKTSRPEVAEAWLAPASEAHLNRLVELGKLNAEEAALGRQVPMCDDLCVEADGAWNTESGNLSVLLPTMQRLRDSLAQQHGYRWQVRVGGAGGIGTPESAAAAFMLGADFILTGSINQCTVEANTSEMVKDLLAQVNVQDTALAPAIQHFEMGAKARVLKRGVFFPMRAEKLYELYRRHENLTELDDKTRIQLQDKFYSKDLNKAFEDAKAYYQKVDPEEVKRAERSPKGKLAMLFKWYLVLGDTHAQKGNKIMKVNAKVYTGPALGAFNQWVKGTAWEDWRQRNVDTLTLRLLEDTAAVITNRIAALAN